MECWSNVSSQPSSQHTSAPPVHHYSPGALMPVPIPRCVDEVRVLKLPERAKAVVFGSDEKSFCVTATLIIRNGKALLIDAKFNKTDPKAIIRYLKRTGVELTDLFISHGDPDYYFGLEEIKAAFPCVVAKTTPEVARHITNTVWNKLVVWRDVLQDQVPRNVVLPEILTATSFVFQGITFELYGADRARIALYSPQLSLVVGGPSIVSGNHMFLADMPTAADRARWRSTLVQLRALNPRVVIPGHSDLLRETFTLQAIDFSIAYLDRVAAILPTVSNSQQFISRMLETYPNLRSYDVLVLSARVLTGEMQWV